MLNQKNLKKIAKKNFFENFEFFEKKYQVGRIWQTLAKSKIQKILKNFFCKFFFKFFQNLIKMN